MKKFNKLAVVSVVSALSTSGAHAALDTTTAVAAIGETGAVVTAIGLAILGISAIVFGIKKAISLASGR